MNFKNKAIFWDRDGIINQITVKNGKSYLQENFQNSKYIHSFMICYLK